MKKKLVIIIPIALILIIAASLLFYFFSPISLKTGVGNIQAEDIIKIELISNNNNKSIGIEDKNEINELYNKISDVKLTAKIPEDKSGWSYGLKIYTKNSDGFVFYVTNMGFVKSDEYNGSVKDNLWYIDNSKQIEDIIIKNISNSDTKQ